MSKQLQSVWVVVTAAFVALVLASCGSGSRAPAKNRSGRPVASAAVPLSLEATATHTSTESSSGANRVSTPAQAAMGMQDVGRFVVGASPLVVSNRETLAVVSLAQGDTVQFPAGMSWDPSPNYVPNPEFFLAPSVTVSGHKIYVSVDGTEVHFASVDDHTYQAKAAGDILIYPYSQDDPVAGPAIDHGLRLDSQGHLWLNPDPIAMAAVVSYGTGEQLDVRGARTIGIWTPPKDGFMLTFCDLSRCFISYQGGAIAAPSAGTVSCVGVGQFDFVSRDYQLEFQWLNTGGTTNGPPQCLPRSHVAGEMLTQGFGHWSIHATSSSGEPLSFVAARDGTLYLGSIPHSVNCPPCRGN